MKNIISKKTLFTILLILGISLGNGGKIFSQGWQFAKSQGGNADDGARITVTDPTGNVYVAGTFYSASMPIGTLTPLTNAGVGTTDAFLAKFDANGNALWSQRIGGAQYDDISGITLDATGQVWVAGSFNSTLISVPPATMGNSNSSGNFYDGYIAVFNSIGSCQGLVAFGGTGDQFATGCVFSGSQNCLYVTGNYATPTMTVAPVTLTNSSASGKFDIFLARFTTAGTVTWAKTSGGINSDDRVSSISVDASGFPYIGGTYSPSLINGTTVIGTTTLTSIGFQDIYLAKYNTAGTFQWAKGIGSNQGGDYLSDIKIDGSSNLCISGYYQSASLSVGTITLSNTAGYDAFVAQYNSAGTVQWANKIGAAYDEYGYGLDVDGANNIYMTGAFNSTAVAIGTTTLANTTTTISYTDAFVAKYNSAGTPQWAVNPTGSYNEVGYDVSSDVLGNVYLVGQFNVAGPTAFGTTTLTSAGLYDSFLAKIGCLTATIAGITTICSGSSTTLTASGATNYTWSTGATTPSIVISPSVTSTYTIIGNTGSCTVSNSNAYTVSVLPASINAGPDYSLTCGQKQLISAVTTPTLPSSVLWTPTTGLSNPAILTPTATAGSTLNQYTVTATLSNGCVVKDYVNVSSFAPTPQLCMVTVDSLSTNNEVYWDKTMYTKIDSFIVYRETSTNIFKRIAALGKNALSMYIDTARSIGPNNGNPNLASYKYKLQLRDSCGNYSVLSPWHQTIFIQDQQNGNFNWTPYAIEGTTVTPVSNYVLKRRDLASSVETTVSATSGNLTSDPNYSSYSTTNVKWFVDAQGFNCTPTFKTNGILVTKLKTKSNQSNEKTFPTLGVHENGLSTYDVNIYPNPTRGIVNIEVKGLNTVTTAAFNSKFDIQVTNTLGQTVYQQNTIEQQETAIDLQFLKSGIYFISLKQNGAIAIVKKIVVE